MWQVSAFFFLLNLGIDGFSSKLSSVRGKQTLQELNLLEILIVKCLLPVTVVLNNVRFNNPFLANIL
jgi:hypothetical protein